MTTGSELARALTDVRAPSEDGFTVTGVPHASGYRIGRGVDGAVVLLTPPDVDPDPPTRLRRLWLDPSLLCSLESDGTTTEGTFGVVQLRLGGDDLLEPFLDVVAALVRLIGDDPGPGDVSAGMRRLVRLFDPTSTSRGSVLGLWAELVVLDLCDDLTGMLDAWHAYVDSKHDFAAEGSRLEVKATTRPTRAHEFSLDQLQLVEGAVVHVASIMTTETLAGTSVGDLVERLRSRLAGDASRQMRLHEQVGETLGPDWSQLVRRRFDEAQAVEGLRIFRAEMVPRPADPPAQVTGVRFTTDCSEVEVAVEPGGLASLLGSPDAG